MMLPSIPSSISMESVLLLDLGEANTRLSLFDVVDGKYRFISAASSPTTRSKPFNHVGYGVRMALEQLEHVTGRTFIGENGRLVLPRREDGAGVDGFVLVVSAGEPMKVVVAGLCEDVSLESARRLAQSIPSIVLGTLHLNDRKDTYRRMEWLMRAMPEAVVFAGGLDGGAYLKVMELTKQLEVFCNLLPKEKRPQILYTGNSALAKDVENVLSSLTEVRCATNIRPGLDVERLLPAHARITDIHRADRLEKIIGLKALDGWAQGKLSPSSIAFLRTIRFLSKDDAAKGVLGVDVGTRHATCAAAWGEQHFLEVFSKFESLPSGEYHLSEHSLDAVMRWMYLNVPEDYVRDYLCNKILFPASVPMSFKDLAIEHALVRVLLRRTAQTVTKRINIKMDKRTWKHMDLLPAFEPVIATGSVLTRAPDLAYSALLLLDGLQPTGMTTLILDQNHLTAVLGAAAMSNPALAVQVIDSSAFLNLGMVIAPVSREKPGTPVLRLRMVTEAGVDEKLEVRQGELKFLPLEVDQLAQLWLKPLHGADIGMGSGRGGRLNKVTGGALGIIIDARGRPLLLPEDLSEKRELFKQWLTTLRG